MAPHIEDFLLLCVAQSGDRYVFGTEASPLDPDPHEWDCSELFEWASKRAKLIPSLPDGAYYQWRFCVDNGGRMDVEDALKQRGVLLFHGDGTGVGRDAITHVACSIGNNLTIEARGSKWGVGTWASPGRFQFAARIPGVDYSPRQPLPPPAASREDLLMAAAKDDHDARWALVLQWFVEFLGRVPDSTAEHDAHVKTFDERGAGACLSGIVNSPEAVELRKRRGW